MRKLAVLLVFLLAFQSVAFSINLGKTLKTLNKVKKVSAAVRPISEEEEYYIGRAVAANILSRYPLLKNEILSRYIHLAGLALAYRSQRPETFGGYHFAVLDSDEINALSAPGGIIFITRGLLQICENEDELAAVLAHEISHIVARDPIKAIKSERMKGLGAFTAGELAGGGSEVMELFQNTVLDISGTLLQKGYSRTQEKDADLAALGLLDTCGYEAGAMLQMLKKLESSEKKKAKVFSAHPSCAKRIEYVGPQVKAVSASGAFATREARFRNTRSKSGV